MASKKSVALWRATANFFGVVGYIFCLLQWLWVTILYAPLLLENRVLRALVLPQHDTTLRVPTASITGPPLLLSIIGIVITIFILGLSIVILVKLPITIARTGSKAAQKTARTALPVVTHHKQIPKKQLLQLTAKLVALLKYTASVFALLLLVGVLFIPTTLSKDVLVGIGVMFASGAILAFTAQYAIAWWRKLKFDTLL